MAITVSNTTELYSALRTCKGGETILLKGGQYGELGLNSYMKPATTIDFPSTVTIASADPANPAVFSKADVRDASNIAFEGITFDYTFKPGDPQNLTPFSFSYCDGLIIKDCTFDGDEAYGVSSGANGYGSAVGLFVRGSTDTVIEGNESYGFWKGMNITDNDNMVVRSNELHSMRMDGMVFSQMDGLLIEDNYIHDFKGSPSSGDHCDMIQFYTTGTTEPSKDVVIRDNVLDIGEGTFTQSIFMRNEVVDSGKASFSKMAYRDVTIEDNTIINGHQWGIYVGEAVGLTISQNTLTHGDGNKPDGPDHPVEMPQISVAEDSRDVSVTENVAYKVLGYSDQSDWTVWGNPTELGEASGEDADTLSVRVSGDAWNGDPTFKLTLNGATLDTSTIVTADHAEREWQTVTFKGDFNLDGSDRVGVTFTNDRWGGTSSTDRNLYVDEVSLNDQISSTNRDFTHNGTQYWDF